MGLHQIFHIAIAAFVFAGWVFFPVIHAPFCVGIIVHWLLNKNRCILSDDYEDKNGFTTELLGRVGINIAGNETLKSIVPYLLVAGPLAVSVYLAIKGYSFGPDMFKKELAYTGAILPIILTLKKVYDMFFGRVAFRGGVEDAEASANASGNHTAPVAAAEEAPVAAEAPSPVEETPAPNTVSDSAPTDAVPAA
jgi:hypothetical protein